MAPTNKGKPKNDTESATRRRAGTSLEDFAHRKGVTKAIRDFRKRKEQKRTHTAKALRQYQKTMKQEGFQPGRGASRKRTENEDVPNAPKPKWSKANPFANSIKLGEERKKQVQQGIIHRMANEKEREKKIKERRRRSKQLRERTIKGQPVMKHVIQNILRKLEREPKGKT